MSSENPQENSPARHRLALVIGGMVLGVIVAYLFGALGGGQVKTLDLIFWIVGGALLGLSASLPSQRK